MLNKVQIMGRLTREPELRYAGSNNTPVASFAVACERDFKGSDGEKQTDFFECVAWRNTAEFISKYFSKGRVIVVDGRLQSRKWEDRDGNKRTAIEIIVENAYFGDSKRDGDERVEQKNFNGIAVDTSETIRNATNELANGSNGGGFMTLDDDEGELPF